MPDKKQINPRLKKLEQKSPERYLIQVDWSDYKEGDDEPPPGEIWLIWGANDEMIVKRGKK